MEKNQKSIGHETEDASVRGIVYTGIGLAISIVVAGLIVYGSFHFFREHRPAAALPNPMEETERQQFPPAPRIEEHPMIEVRELRAHEDQVLSTYGWTDKKNGVVHIPIERAMELQLERGFPVRKQAAAK